MRLGYIISHASGQDRSDVHFLVLRFDQRYGFKPGEGESWIMRSSAGKLYNLYGGLSWFTGLWRSPAGHVYAASADSAVFVNADPGVRAGPWKDPRPGSGSRSCSRRPSFFARESRPPSWSRSS